MLILQVGLLLCGLYLIFSRATPEGVWQRTIGIAIVFFFPPLFAWSGAITKDILMVGFALLAAGLTLRLKTLEYLPRLQQIGLWVSIWVCLSMVASLRHNGVFIAIILIIYVFLLLKPLVGKWRAFQQAGLLILLVVSSTFLINQLLVTKKTWPVASLLIFDVAGIAVRHLDNPVFIESNGQKLSHLFLIKDNKLNVLQDFYNPQDWLYLKKFPLKFPESDSEVEQLRSLWFDLILNYPGSYLAHRWAVFSALLALGDRTIRDPVCMSSKRVENRIKNEELVESTPERSELQKVIAWRLDQLLTSSFLFKPYFFLLLAPLVFGLALWWRLPQQQFIGVLIGSGLAYQFSMFFITPAAEYRYSLWMICCVFLSIIMICIERINYLRRDRRVIN